MKFTFICQACQLEQEVFADELTDNCPEANVYCSADDCFSNQYISLDDILL